ncbi:MAG TPA: histidine kinase dimerization/phospho-acceptor domain-containing protein, partial [Kofleriaceae bacterium]|nr:histidine kinase dimerization/phospho-acceptor domain-containing protein [Kofleriaceae bacterium]
MAWATARARLRRLAGQLARIRYRLLLVNAIVVAVPVVGISFARMHETQLLAALEADMVHQAALVRAVVLAAPDRPLAALEPVLAAAAGDTRTRIRLLDAHGEVQADSHRGGPPEGAERPVPRLLRGRAPDHAAGPPRLDPADPPAQRREVIEALAGRYGSATRMWTQQDRVYLFAALPIQRPGVPGGVVDGVVYATRSTHDVKLQLYRLRAWLFRLLAATLAITALVSLILATTIARPLARLTRRAQRIAARLPAEPDRLAERADEIGQLARAVAAMTDELERRAHDARTLAADISHEFKTPLTAIRGAAELLRDGAGDDPADRDRFLAMILDDAARLDRLVSRLLELARVEDDRGIELPVDLAELAAACAARPWLAPVELAAGAAAVVSGRRAQLATALDNLVANAAQFAEPGMPVRIAIAPRGTGARITVANRGPALSPAARARVWDRFYSTRVASGGSGLGLAIVRSVALGHGGAVGVDCADGITAFWLELPVSRA